MEEVLPREDHEEVRNSTGTVPGANSHFSRYNKENVPSRAYIAFRDPERLTEFSRAYDGHTFRDKAGENNLDLIERSLVDTNPRK